MTQPTTPGCMSDGCRVNTPQRRLPIRIYCRTVVAKQWIQSRSQSMDGWVKEMWCTRTMELYLAGKKNGLLFAEKWMGLEIMMLSELSQTWEDKYVEMMFKCIHI